MIKKYIKELKIILTYLFISQIITLIISFLFKNQICWFFIKNQQIIKEIISLNISDIFIGYLKIIIIYTMYTHLYLYIYILYIFINKGINYNKAKFFIKLLIIITILLLLLSIINYTYIIPNIWIFLSNFEQNNLITYTLIYKFEFLRLINLLNNLYLVNIIIILLLCLLLFINNLNKTILYNNISILILLYSIVLLLVPPIITIQLIILIIFTVFKLILNLINTQYKIYKHQYKTT